MVGELEDILALENNVHSIAKFADSENGHHKESNLMALMLFNATR